MCCPCPRPSYLLHLSSYRKMVSLGNHTPSTLRGGPLHEKIPCNDFCWYYGAVHHYIVNRNGVKSMNLHLWIRARFFVFLFLLLLANFRFFLKFGLDSDSEYQMSYRKLHIRLGGTYLFKYNQINLNKLSDWWLIDV